MLVAICAEFCAFMRVVASGFWNNHACITMSCSETDVCFVIMQCKVSISETMFPPHSMCRSTVTSTSSTDKLQQQISILPCTGSSTVLGKRALCPIQHWNAKIDYLRDPQIIQITGNGRHGQSRDQI